MKTKLSTLLRSLLPPTVYRRVRLMFRMFRSTWRSVRRAISKKRTLEILKSDLRSAGMASGDTIMVHSSLSRIGNVKCGAATVVNSLIDTVGSDGTVVMPCYGSAENIQQKSEEGSILDLRTAKPNTGVITDVFRKMLGTMRSSHPFSSVCARGKNQEYIISQHAANPYVCHAQSPIGRIVELNAQIIGLGVPIAVGLGVAHYLEDTYDRFPFSVHAPPFNVTYIGAEGNTITRPVIRYDPVRAATRIDHAKGQWILAMFTSHFTRLKIIRWFKYGEAKSWVMQAMPLYEELRRLAAKGITMYLTRDEWLKMNAGDESIESW